MRLLQRAVRWCVLLLALLGSRGGALISPSMLHHIGWDTLVFFNLTHPDMLPGTFVVRASGGRELQPRDPGTTSACTRSPAP